MLPPRGLLELAVYLKLASEAMSDAAEHAAALRPDRETAERTVAWTRTMDDLTAMNIALGSIERIVRAAVRDQTLPLGAAAALTLERRSRLRS